MNTGQLREVAYGSASGVGQRMAAKPGSGIAAALWERAHGQSGCVDAQPRGAAGWRILVALGR